MLEAEGIPVEIRFNEPKRLNLVARLKGSGARRPLLIMWHTDDVNVGSVTWKHSLFGAVRNSGYIYGWSPVDDKDPVGPG